MGPEIERRETKLPPRNLGALLDETVAIYVSHFRRFVLLIAVVQLPVSLATLVVYEAFGGRTVAGAVAGLLAVFGAVFAYGAVTYAVGQKYVVGGIDIRRCYAMVWERVLSLMILALVFFAIAGIVLAPIAVSSQSPMAGLALVMVFPAVALAIYWSMSVQAVIVEHYKAMGALRRSFTLIRGSWWRIFGISLVIGLVVFGLGIVLSSPFAFIGPDPSSGLGTLLRFLVSLVVELVVPPVLFIAGTLLYYDMRVRKEAYDLATLSRELRIAAV